MTSRRDWRPRFIKAIREGASHGDACDLAGVERSTPHKRVDAGDTAFETEWKQAAEDWEEERARRAEARVKRKRECA